MQYDFDSIFRYKILKYIYLCNSNFHSLSVSFCLIKITFRKIRIDRIVHDVTSNRGDHDSCTYKEKHSQCSLNSIYRVDLAWWNTQIMRIRADNRPEGVYEKKIYFERMRLALVTIYSVLRIRTLSFVSSKCSNRTLQSVGKSYRVAKDNRMKKINK